MLNDEQDFKKYNKKYFTIEKFREISKKSGDLIFAIKYIENDNLYSCILGSIDKFNEWVMNYKTLKTLQYMSELFIEKEILIENIEIDNIIIEYPIENKDGILNLIIHNSEFELSIEEFSGFQLIINNLLKN